MKTPSDQELKQLIAKMLPEKYCFVGKHIYHCGKIIEIEINQVPDEWFLQICWEIEEGLNKLEQFRFVTKRKDGKRGCWKLVSL